MGLITLLTDFGYRDNYVGVMKGVILSINPTAQIVDLTHGIQPQDILAARFNLLTSYEYFPANTIHIVVVDPGVGTQRAVIAAQVAVPTGVQTIVAPDNGILTGFPITAAAALTNSAYWRTSQPSSTFHGRDIFAPAAAHLANGISIEELGDVLSAHRLVSLGIGRSIATERGYYGSIQYIDHFGNLVTTISGASLTDQPWCVQLGGDMIPYCATYGNAKPGQRLALIGSHGYVEIAVNGGNAAVELNANLRDSVKLHLLGVLGS